MDVKPTSIMNYDLPPRYLDDGQNNDIDWKMGFDVAPECPKDKPYLSLIKTARANLDQRALIRIHYQLDYRKVKSVPYPAIRFLLGRGGENEDPQISKAVEDEIEKFGDIIVGSFEDTYDNLPLKTLTGYSYIHDKCGSDLTTNPQWISFHDDDALIYPDKLISFTKSSKAEPLNCFGFLGDHSRPHRWGKYNVTLEQWESGHWFPQFCSGPCNGMKKSAALKIFNAARKTETKGFKLEDVLFTGIIRTKAKMPVPHFEKDICMHVSEGVHSRDVPGFLALQLGRMFCRYGESWWKAESLMGELAYKIPHIDSRITLC